MKLRKDKYKFYYDKHARNQLRPLREGENVIMLRGKEWLPAEVSKKHYNPRSYIVKTDNGKRFRRNRKHLRPTKSHWPTPDNEESFRNAEPPTLVEINPRETQEEPLTSNIPASPQRINTEPNNIQRAPSSDKTTRSGRIIKTPLKFKDCVKA